MNKFKHLISIMAAGAVMWSCSSEEGNYSRIIGLDDSFEPIELSRSEAEVSEGLLAFTMDYLKASHELMPNENVIFSPLGAAMTTGMIANGLSEEDATEMLERLHLGNGNISALNSFARTVLDKFPTIDKNTTFTTANLTWVKNSIGLTNKYENSLDKIYDSEIMKGSSWNEMQAKEIENWISLSTDGALKGMFNVGSEDLSLLWLNVLHFKGAWTDKFDKTKTSKADFYCEDNEIRNVDMMHYDKPMCITMAESSTGGTWDKLINCATIPYGNTAFCFSAFLPPTNNPNVNSIFDDFETVTRIINFTKSGIEDLLNCDYPIIGDPGVYLPKMSERNTIDLIPTLKQMGLVEIFNRVEFSEMISSANDSEETYTGKVDKFNQVMDFSLDEEGSEIKVVTVAKDGYGASSFPELHFNRPFVYMVWERSTGAVLLAGIYMHP